MIRLTRAAGLAALVACLIAVALSGVGAAAGPVAHAARSCSFQKTTSDGGYVYQLKVRHVSCHKGKKVAMANDACHRRHHSRSACGHTKGYRCRQHNWERSSIEFDADVACKRGHKRISVHYQVNT